MANNEQVSQEYLLIKCFVYKYTPPFNQQAGVTASLSTFSPYSIPLDDTAYFTKYDISSFVSDYSFGQNIDETTFGWSLTLQDLALSYATINTKLKVTPPSGSTMTGGLAFSNANSSNSLGLISEYEANALTFDNNDYTSDEASNPTLNAKFQRGKTPGPLTVQNSSVSQVISTVPGLRLSDLIQEYDFISLFLYKNTTPLSNIYGTVTINSNAGVTNTTTGSVSEGSSAASTSAPTSISALQNNPLYVFNYAFTASDQLSFGNAFNQVNFQTLTASNLQYESILMTKMSNGQTLFSNEFNGFVIKKNISSNTNQVDKIVISGNGWSRLFGSTKRVVKPSLFQNSLYQNGQLLGASDVSATETALAGRTISQIIRDLFDLVYRIDFNVSTNTTVPGVTAPINSKNSTNLATSTQSQAGFFASPTGVTTSTTSAQVSQQLILQNSFYNITSLIAANSYPANLFNLPQYLLSSVMKLRPFAYIEPLTVPATSSFINGIVNEAASVTSVSTADAASNFEVSPETFQQVTQSYDTGTQVLNYNSTNPVYVEPNLQNLVAYFTFLAEVFQPYSPELQTPYEILDQIRSQAFVEIYEQPNGQFIVRAPQYNNMAVSLADRPDISMVRSSNLNIISTNYTETVENLITKLFAGYSPNITPQSLFQQFGYCDGKLLIQNGLLEMTTAANPNTATASLTNTSTNNSKTTGIFGYAEYLMALSNAKLKTGTIVCDLDNTVQVGQTFIDEIHYKFGYIIGVSKQVSVAGTATMTIALSYVRDAVPVYDVANNITDINVDLLPVLSQIEESFVSSTSSSGS